MNPATQEAFAYGKAGPKKLLVLIPDRLTDLIEKGEIQPRYYNPGNLFKEVVIMSTTVDDADRSVLIENLKKTVGDAKLDVRFFSDDLTLPPKRLSFLAPRRLRKWAAAGVELIRQISPDLIRCHGCDWATYLASEAKRKLGTPYVVSLHINPDVNALRRFPNPSTAAEHRHNQFYDHIEANGLRAADQVMPVYQPIVPYLNRLGVTDFDVYYNVLNGERLHQKTDYNLHSPAELIYVGRLLENEKDPSNIIDAVEKISGVRLTIVGDGPLRPRLEERVSQRDLENRIIFRPAIANDELCAMLPSFDLFVVHTEYWEISKSVLEALLTGLPVIINQRLGEPVPEFTDDIVRLVPNTELAYGQAIESLLTDHLARERLGRNAFDHASKHWAPEITERRVVELYNSILDPSQNGALA